MRVAVTVNDTEYAREVEPRLLLIHFLRDELGLTGSHWGCDTSNCGTCVVLMDGEPLKSCTLLAATAAGHEILTVEGLEIDLLSSVRRKNGEAFLKENFPPPALKDPLKDSDYLVATAASKSILPEFLKRAETPLSKKDFFQIAAQMRPEEIHDEVNAKLDAMMPILNEGLPNE